MNKWWQILGLGLLGFCMVACGDVKPIPYQLKTVDYNALHATPSPSLESISSNLKEIKNSGYTGVRTYYPQANGGEIPLMPEIAKNDVNVLLGLFVFDDSSWTENDYIHSVKPYLSNNHLLGILVGNEDYSSHAGVINQFVDQIKQDAPDVPVSSAQAFNFWLNRNNDPEVAAFIDRSDFIAVNIYPDWDWQNPSRENQPLSRTSPQHPMTPEEGYYSFIGQVNALRDKYPNKQIVVTETGWPTTYGPADEKAKQYQLGLDNAHDYNNRVGQWSKDNQITVFKYNMYDDRYAAPEISKYNPHFGELDADGKCKVAS